MGADAHRSWLHRNRGRGRSAATREAASQWQLCDGGIAVESRRVATPSSLHGSQPVRPVTAPFLGSCPQRGRRPERVPTHLGRTPDGMPPRHRDNAEPEAEQPAAPSVSISTYSSATEAPALIHGRGPWRIQCHCLRGRRTVREPSALDYVCSSTCSSTMKQRDGSALISK